MSRGGMLCSHERLVERTSPSLPARVVHHRLRPQARGGGAARRPADRGQADRRRHRGARQPAPDAGPREEAVGARRDLLRTAREVPRRQRQARPGRGGGRGRARTSVARGVRRRLPRRRERPPPRRREQPLQRRHDHPDRDRRRPGRDRAAQRRVAGARAAGDQGSAGIAFRATIVRCRRPGDALRTLGAAGFTSYGLDASATTTLYEQDLEGRSLFVLGNETEGLSAASRDLVDVRLSIPMAHGVESLNVASAAAVIAFEVARRR